jgi:hypothetical protein
LWVRRNLIKTKMQSTTVFGYLEEVREVVDIPGIPTGDVDISLMH